MSRCPHMSRLLRSVPLITRDDPAKLTPADISSISAQGTRYHPEVSQRELKSAAAYVVVAYDAGSISNASGYNLFEISIVFLDMTHPSASYKSGDTYITCASIHSVAS